MPVVHPGPVPVSPSRLGAEIVHWPDTSGLLDHLRAERRPRLVLVPRGTPPPPGGDDLEEWLWLPTDERDLHSRLQRLEARSRAAPIELDQVTLDEGTVWVGPAHVALPPIEAALLACLLGPPTAVRSREELHRAAWGDAARRTRSLDSRVFALRRRIAPLGLIVVAVRGRGFVLAVHPDRTGTAP